MLLDCLVYSCFGYWEFFPCSPVFILHNSALMGFFGTSFSYFKIILLYIFTVSVLVSATYWKNPYSFLLENGNKNLHVGTYYSQQTMHEYPPIGKNLQSPLFMRGTFCIWPSDYIHFHSELRSAHFVLTL